MNFTELKAELAARGFDYLSSTRQGQYINWARAELDDAELWPYRRTTATGAAPLTIATLGPIESVYDTVTLQALGLTDFRDLRTSVGDVTTVGTPTSYYVATPTIVSVYPVGTDSLSVTHYAVPPDLTGSDTPLAPTRFHGLLVDMAVQRAYRDADNHDSASALQAEIDRQVNNMRNALLLVNVDGPQGFIEQRAGW